MNNPVTGKIRKYEAPTIFEAYTKLKRDLGEEAIILKTRTFTKGGILGLWGKKVVEITASGDAPQKKAREKSPPNAVSGNSLINKTYGVKPQAQVVEKAKPPQVTDQLAGGNGEGAFYTDFKKELGDIRRMILDMQESGRFRHWPEMPPEFQKAFKKLQKFNIHEDIARGLIQRWLSHYPEYQSGDRVDISHLEKYVSEMIVPAGPIHIRSDKKPTVVMLVGPTGVGKTTTIAKLAARYKLKEGLNVGFITIDTYRIAAVEQLRTYADLIGVPVKVVSTTADMKPAIDFFADKDLVLIDTAGRSPNNREKMEDLKAFVDSASPDELHLVLSSNVHNDVMQDTMDKFDGFPVSKLLLTKLDEAVHAGIILTIISKTQKPIGYITIGQEVPEDIEVVESRRLSRLILGLEKVHG